MGLSLELRPPSRGLVKEGCGVKVIAFSPPRQSTWRSSTCQFTILPLFSLSPQHVREEQRKAKARELASFSKDDGISELNDKVKEAFGGAAQRGFIPVSLHHTGLEGPCGLHSAKV